MANTAAAKTLDNDHPNRFCQPGINRREITRNAVLVFLCFAAFYIVPLGRAPFSSQGESREAFVVKNMLEQQNYILPLRNGEEIPSKPPFFHWLAALSAKAFGGLDEFTVRFPSALSSALALAIFYFLIAVHDGKSRALRSVLILGTTFEWARTSSLARVDLVFTFWLVMAFALFFILFERLEQGKSRSLLLPLLLALSLAGAVLSKGPAGLFIPLFIAGAYTFYCLYQRSSVRKFPLGQFVGITLGAALLAGVWYYLAYLQGGREFLQVQLVKENAARAFGYKGYEIGHRKPFYFSLVYLIISFLPWSLLFPLSLSILWKERRKLLTERFSLYCLFWIGTFLLVVTVAASKRGVYYLPAFPALSYLVAITLERQKQAPQFMERISASLLGIVAVGIFFVALFIGFLIAFNHLQFPRFLHVPGEQALALFSVPAVSLTLLLVGAVFAFAGAVQCWKKEFQQSAKLFSAGTLLLLFSVSQFLFPAIAKTNSPEEFMAKVNATVPAAIPFYLYKETDYAAMFYAKENLTFISSADELAQGKDCFILAQEEYRSELSQVAAVVIESSNSAHYGKEKLLLMKCQAS